nr:MAG TPA: hypothetical protein [Caudoviricetes sp.]
MRGHSISVLLPFTKFKCTVPHLINLPFCVRICPKFSFSVCCCIN